MKSDTSKRILLLTVVSLLGILVLEGVVRLIEPREVLRAFFMTPDPVLHHKFIPNGTGRHKTLEFDVRYAINSLGMREREVPRDKPAGTHRILMLGDSFTEGNGVEVGDAFPAQIQAMIDADGLGDR